MRKVIHLLPYDGIGGVEAAARTMSAIEERGVRFEVRYVFPMVRSRLQRAATFNPLHLLRATRAVLIETPDVLVVSLWRSAIVGILVRLLRPRTKLVVLIHNSVDAHLLDFVFTRWAIALSCEVWADSQASMAQRFRRLPGKPVRTISFLTSRITPAVPEPPRPVFAFWGRLAPQKNLPRAIEVFETVRRDFPGAQFLVIGPDCGELERLQSLCTSRGLEHCVQFFGPLDFAAIRRRVQGSSFYLQTSDYEGMAMSVVEAMQLGLVPVVTPVGEIGRYCADGRNAVIVRDSDEAAAKIVRLLQDPVAYEQLRTSAVRTWDDKPVYREAVLTECLRLAQG